MSWENIEVTSELLNDAIKFHGHLGPFLVLGLKAGLLANKILGKDCFEMKASIKTILKPPYSCFIDGVQVATGCTIGKGNLKIEEGYPITATFIKKGKALEVKLKKETLEIIGIMHTEADSKQKAFMVINKSIDDLFNISTFP